ncbi:JNK-interacting protein 1-like isoform X2 [Varroa destructor]|nr:JNK-interacting protein 1-like isoform X2 [Varroa destructor]XP_022668157.1 JNK-interacting protein 1-like isoform X2 [Varroa destructor]
MLTKMDTQCYRLVEVDTPLSPQRDLVASFNDVESMRIKANGPGSAPDAISSGASSTQPKASAEAPAATAPPTLPMFWSFTEPSEFLKRHPTGQNSRTLPDLKVGLKPKRRRRLPEIPKNRKPLQGLSLAEEFQAIDSNLLVTPFSSQLYLEIDTSGQEPRSTFRYYSNTMTEKSSVREGHTNCGSEEYRSSQQNSDQQTSRNIDVGDVVKQPSGNSVALENCRNLSKILVDPEPEKDSGHSSSSLSSPCSALCGPLARLCIADATHRGIHRFVPRHGDELAIDLGDPIYVIRECSIEDSWCEGINLATGRKGVFPHAYITDVDYSEFSQDSRLVLRRERFLLHFLGSVEVSNHRGNNILCQAIRKLIREGNRAQLRARIENKLSTKYVKEVGSALEVDSEQSGITQAEIEAEIKAREGVESSKSESWSNSIEQVLGHSCVLEISEEGLRIVDRRTNQQDYFFTLKNVTFCGYHPTDHRYLGFISKHPLLYRFACHVFFAEDTAHDVATSVRAAFERFYRRFMDVTFPTEDIYIDDPAV